MIVADFTKKLPRLFMEHEDESLDYARKKTVV